MTYLGLKSENFVQYQLSLIDPARRRLAIWIMKTTIAYSIFETCEVGINTIVTYLPPKITQQ